MNEPFSPASATPDRDQIAAAQAKLAIKLLAPHAQAPQAVISPASLTSAVATISLGASPTMKASLMQALSFPQQPPELSERQLREARAALMSADPTVFIAADRFVYSPEIPPSAAMLETFARLGVSHAALDLRTPAGVEAVNAWVKQATRGEIDGILSAPFPGPIAFALNALFFKAKWATPFDPAATAEADFFAARGGRGRARMMRQQAKFMAFEAPGFVGVDLPFANPRYAMTIVTTTDRPSPLADFADVGGWLCGAGFSRRLVTLSLPRFRVDTKDSLMPALADDLKPGLASPTPFAGFDPGFTIGGIYQRTLVEVDEEGAKAAAVTSIERGGIAMAPPLVVEIDKPFLFALRDRDSGLILVAGYVGEAPEG